MAVISVISNYFLVYPFYTNFMPMDTIIGMYSAIFPSIDNLLEALIKVNVPFTFTFGGDVKTIIVHLQDQHRKDPSYH